MAPDKDGMPFRPPRNPPGSAALVMAACTGDVKLIKGYLERGSDVNERIEFADRSITALIAAVASGKKEAVRLLIDAGADLEGKDWRGMTALSRAEEDGFAEIAQMLREAAAAEMERFVRASVVLQKPLRLLAQIDPKRKPAPKRQF